MTKRAPFASFHLSASHCVTLPQTFPSAVMEHSPTRNSALHMGPALAATGSSDNLDRRVEQAVLDPPDLLHEPSEQRPRKRIREAHECEICGTSYGERRTLLRHYKTPAHCRKAGIATPSYPCTYCRKTFSRNDIRLRHEAEVHRNVRRQRREPFQEPRIGDHGSLDEWSFDQRGGIQSTSIDLDSLICNWETSAPCSETSSPSRFGGSPEPEVEQRSTSSVSTDDSRLSVNCLQPSRISSRTSDEDENNDLEIGKVTAAEPSAHIGESRDSGFSNEAAFPLSDKLTGRQQLLRRRALLRRNGATLRPAPSNRGPLCVLCRMTFGDTQDEIRSHLERHLQELHGEHMCEVCQVGFVRWIDLEWHKVCAKEQHCGYQFEHERPCTGHHPSSRLFGQLSDHDRLRMWSGLRNWEQAQLQAFNQNVEDAFQILIAQADDHWSIGAVCRRSIVSITSLSTMMSHLTTNSTPKEVDYGALLSTVSIENNISKRLAGPSRLGRLQPSALIRSVKLSKARLDASLNDAAQAGDVTKARQLLRAGADVDSRRSTCLATPLTLAVIGGHAPMAALLLSRGGKFNHVVFFHCKGQTYEASRLEKSVQLIRPLSEESLDPSEIVTSCGGNLKMYSYVIPPSNGKDTQPIKSEELRPALHEHACSMAVGPGLAPGVELFAPRALVEAYSLDKLPAAIMLAYAIAYDYVDLVVLLIEEYSLDWHRVHLRQLLRTDRKELLSGILGLKHPAVQKLKDDWRAIKMAAFDINEAALDLLLFFARPDRIQDVLCMAIAKNRQDAVFLLCSKTSAMDSDPLYRRYDPVRCPADDLDIWKLLYGSLVELPTLDYPRIYFFLVMANSEQKSDIINRLANAGAHPRLMFEAMRNIGEFGYGESLYRESRMGFEFMESSGGASLWGNDDHQTRISGGLEEDIGNLITAPNPNLA